MRATDSQNRGSEERFYIGNDRGTLCGLREGANRELRRNPKAASVPHLPVAVRPYTLNGREERSPGRLTVIDMNGGLNPADHRRLLIPVLHGRGLGLIILIDKCSNHPSSHGRAGCMSL